MRILSIDPGTNRTGVSILEYRDAPFVLFSETIYAEKMLYQQPYIEEIHGSRFARIYITASHIEKLLYIYKPDIVVSESPYMGKFANSFAALTELITSIRMMTFHYNDRLEFVLIDPASVKKFMGVSGKSGDKELMRKALTKQQLSYESSISINNLDEHAVDSIAIGLWLIDKLCSIHYGS